ncbi:hypothetical protein [Endomicrobium proavitum]|uniref:PorV/PorQ family protein n=1 Tax=Endomicrobium proavitum TaxID=1408281 RepID=A0A0G3WKQ1_9BACT|nr:hypothetical protein [Endomicrobium proavitum]AKL98054.1 exported protein of unknown function [Endomicrobium proavitum]
MKKRILISLAIIALTAASSWALFDVHYWGVRALGMGGAFSSVSGDINSQIYNIAGIANIKNAEVTGMMSKLFSGMDGVDLNDNYIGAAIPLGKSIGVIAAGWGHFSDPSLRTEDTANFGFARTLDDLIEAGWVSVMLGVNLKYLSHSTEYNGTFGAGKLSKSAFAFDAGFIAKFSNGISVGYTGKYLNTPDMVYYKQNGEDKVSRVDLAGISYYSEELPLLGLPKFTIAADYEIRKADNYLIVGAETKIIDGALALRAGGWSQQVNLGLGYELKIGDNGAALLIDYAFGMPIDMQETYGSHYISLGYKFGSAAGFASESSDDNSKVKKKNKKEEEYDPAAYLLGNSGSSSDNSNNSVEEVKPAPSQAVQEDDSDYDPAAYLLGLSENK